MAHNPWPPEMIPPAGPLLHLRGGPHSLGSAAAAMAGSAKRHPSFVEDVQKHRAHANFGVMPYLNGGQAFDLAICISCFPQAWLSTTPTNKKKSAR